jgi:hypothetical protein
LPFICATTPRIGSKGSAGAAAGAAAATHAALVAAASTGANSFMMAPAVKTTGVGELARNYLVYKKKPQIAFGCGRHDPAGG